MHTHAHARTHIHTCTHTRTHTDTHTHIHTHTRTHTHAQTCTHTHTHTHTHMHADTHACVVTFTYTCTLSQAWVHVHMHTHIYMIVLNQILTLIFPFSYIPSDLCLLLFITLSLDLFSLLSLSTIISSSFLPSPSSQFNLHLSHLSSVPPSFLLFSLLIISFASLLCIPLFV